VGVAIQRLRGRDSAPGHSRTGFLLAAAMLLAAGCGRSSPPTSEARSTSAGATSAPSVVVESLAQSEARFDATVWRDEITAQRYERTFVLLADEFRRGTNKLETLAAFAFDEIVLPKPKGEPAPLGLGIQRQEFDPTEKSSVPHAAWEMRLRQLAGGGWHAIQAEWTHEKFIPPKDGKGAWSEMAFEIHGERVSGRVRFIVKGRLGVDWLSGATNAPPFRPQRLTVTELEVLERDGLPGFTTHAVVTPNPPDRVGEMVNMHPVLVTDLDGDGDDDIVMAGVNRLFRNDGSANFTPMDFIEEKVFRGSTDAGVIADFNGDGKPDFLTVAKDGSLTNRLALYPGNGALPFSSEPALACDTAKIVAPSAMTAADVDYDGDLDVWVGQYKPPYKGGQLPTPYYDSNDGHPAFLLFNDGHGHFVESTTPRGVEPKRNRRTLAASFVDLNGDDHADLVTVNDYAGVDLYYNDGTGHFTDETARLYNRHLFGMGHCFADFDRDGLMDFLAIGMSVPTVRRLEFMKLGRADQPERTRKRVEMAYGNRAYLQRPGGWERPPFADRLAATGWSWGTTAFDFDNNGAVDVYVANGHISGESIEDYDSHIWTHDIYVGSSREDPRLLAYFDEPFRGINTGKTSSNGYQHNVLLMDTGTNDYVNVAFLMGVAHEMDSRVVVSADLNGDGRMDLILTEGQWMGGPHTGRNRLWIHLNQLATGNHWIGARLAATNPAVSPIGAKVSVRTEQRIYVAQIVTGDSYQSQHPNAVHFGLGKTDHVQEVVVRWANGNVQRLVNPAVDRYHPISP
jgi:hypothetical protein